MPGDQLAEPLLRGKPEPRFAVLARDTLNLEIGSQGGDLRSGHRAPFRQNGDSMVERRQERQLQGVRKQVAGGDRPHLQYCLITPIGRARMQATAVTKHSLKLKPAGVVRAGEGRRFIGTGNRSHGRSRHWRTVPHADDARDGQ